jgi:predicted nucleotidyltransferase
MNIDVSHRANLFLHLISDYYEYADKCIEVIQENENVCSIVLCGSLAKSDVVPGWSDIDLIVLLNERTGGVSDLSDIRVRLSEISKDYVIGVGIDLVYKEEFRKTTKLAGRPYMMTFEVASYGITKYGENFLEAISYSPDYSELVEIERKFLLASELHSWRRNFVFGKYDVGSIDFLFNVCKCLLRILQIETGPNLIAPINSESNLAKYKDIKGESEYYSVLEIALSVRKEWPKYFSMPKEEIEKISLFLANKINLYPYI